MAYGSDEFFPSGSSFGGSPYNMFGNQNLDELYQLPQQQSVQSQGIANEASRLADPFASQRGQYQTMLSKTMANPGEFGSSPAYQFAFDQGLQGVNRSLAKGGMLNSGNRLTELTKYGQGMAGQQYFNQANLLSGLAGARSGSPVGAAQALQGGWAQSQDQATQAAAAKAALQNQQPYRPTQPKSFDPSALAKQLGTSSGSSYSPSDGMSRGSGGPRYGESNGASNAPYAGFDYSYQDPLQQSVSSPYDEGYSFGQPGTYDGPGVGYGTQQGQGGDIPTFGNQQATTHADLGGTTGDVIIGWGSDGSPIFGNGANIDWGV